MGVADSTTDSMIDSMTSHTDARDEAGEVCRASSSPWRMPPWQGRFLLLALLTAVVVLFLRLYRLGSLQNELYGDVVEVRELVDGIFAGQWPYQFVCGMGPLFGYLLVPVVELVGPSYFALKLGSVLVSLGVLLFTYAIGRQLVNDSFALLATFVGGVSSWLLIFSRLGNMPILVPLLVVASLWLVVKIVRRGHWGYAVVCAVVSALGLWVYPPAFVLPGVVLVTMLCLHWAGMRIKRRHFLVFVAVAVVCVLPFAWYVYKRPGVFGTGSYLGSKLATSAGPPLKVLARNVVNALLALHVRGDVVFRSNPVGEPHLDRISGLLFLGGIVFWLLPERRRWSLLLLVPLLLLQVPSMLVLNVPREVPSASRTVGAAPLVYILVASGLWGLVRLSARLGRPRLGVAVAGFLLAGVVFLNVQRYFRDYIVGLPYENTPVGASVAAYTDMLPPEDQVYLVGCCWASGMPETQTVRLEMMRPENLHLLEPSDLSCDRLASIPTPAVLIWSFRDEIPAPQVEPCKQWLSPQLYSFDGRPVFHAASLRVELGGR